MLEFTHDPCRMLDFNDETRLDSNDEPATKKDCLKCLLWYQSEPLIEYLLNVCPCQDKCKKLKIFFNQKESPETVQPLYESTIKRKVMFKMQTIFLFRVSFKSSSKICGSVLQLQQIPATLETLFQLLHLLSVKNLEFVLGNLKYD